MEQYISKSALLTEIEKLRDELQEKVETSDFITGEVFIMNYFISFLDFIEVKEVDLDKEIDAFLNDWGKDMINGGQYGINLDIRECKDIAKRFFELGMAVSNKSQKGE